MYAEGETELRDLIIQNLETSGFLSKIKAELRAGVLIAFEEEGNLRTKVSLFDKKFDAFMDTSNGRLAVSLVREFLDYFNLNFTLSVFDPEIATSSPCLNRSDLCDKLDLKSSEVDGPVLSALLKAEMTTTRTENKQQASAGSSIAHSTTASSLNSRKSLETISEDVPPKENYLPRDERAAEFPTNFGIGNDSLSTNEDSVINPKSSDIALKKSGSEMIDKLRNEHHGLELNSKESTVADIFGTNKSDASIFKVNTNISNDLDNFFDDPLPSQKTSFFGESGLSLSQTKSNDNKLSSLKDLPALTTTTKSKDWSFSKELPNALSSLDPAKPSEIQEEIGAENKTEPDLESNEESSDHQLNSESIEEEIEEDFSGGIDDLLNSSLSLADDATTDQSASQISVVDGIDHIEPVTN